VRRPEDVPPRRPARQGPRSSRGRTLLGVAVAVAVVLILSLRGIARFYTDYLWFDELGFTSVWRGMLASKVVLTVGFTVFFFVLLLGNLVIADRLAPTFRPIGADDEIVARYQELVGPHARKLRVGVALLFALIAGTGAAAQWRSFLLFRNSVSFGQRDPQFDRDISFYMFKLPFASYVVDWLFVALVLVLVLTAVAHYLNGGIRLQSALQRVTPAVKGHLSVLLGLVAMTKAAGYYLQTFELNFSTRGFVDGAGYTDVHAQLPALRLLTLIMIAASVLFLVNIWRRGWALPVVAVLVWAVVALSAGVVYPALVQRFRVEPAQNERERTYIDRNIEATRAAMRLDTVEETEFPFERTLTAEQLAANADTVRNIRLWDPDTLEDTYRALQELRSYYQFADVDIDRYEIEGERRSAVLSVRGLNPHDLPGKATWVNSHLKYTHGYGAVLSSANAVDEQGRPDLLLRDIPPVGTPSLEGNGARIYFSENLPGYAIVRTNQDEIDYTTGGTPATTRYTGDAGVPLSSQRRQVAFALRFGDPNIVLSSELNSRSKVVFNRDIADRVRAAAPFLSYDSDPYPVIAGGRVLWVQDAYTTSSRYPYAQRAEVEGLRAGADLARGGFNYVRNSVKVVIDAFDGTTTYYLMDPDDPVARAYGKAFPRLFTDGRLMPSELREHLRYPEDLFRVQANMFGDYHIDNADVFYASNDDWDIAQDPGTGRVRSGTGAGGGGSGGAGGGAGGGAAPPTTLSLAGLSAGGEKLPRMEPTYLTLRLPGDSKAGFVILQPFVPESRDDRQKNMTAFLVARSDPEDYGRLEVFEMPRNLQVDGPLIVNNAIQSQPEIAREITQLNQQGSSVLFGQVQVIPIERSLLYVRPMYVTSERTQLPEVRHVIVVHNGEAVMRPTLREALVQLFGDAPLTLEERPTGGVSPPSGGTGTGGGTGAGGAVPGEAATAVASLLARAEAAFAAADAALKAGNLAEYQAKIREAQDLIASATRQLRSGSGSGGGAAGGGASGGSGSTTTTTAAPTSA
jgi:uncharacterized membrane protein (UPF0182 family)